MAKKSTIKLLLINESDNEGERLISLFRNAGRVARAHRATSVEDLHTKLETKAWDLLIANDKHPEISVDQCLAQIKKQHSTLPVIVIRDQDTQAALESGASDVVALNDDQRLVFAAFRELAHLEKHQKLNLMQAKLKEAEERCQLLMAQSSDALAYISDGMLISVNSLFCTRFAYDSIDDLECAPFIDLIADSDQDKIKSLLKNQNTNTKGNSVEFEFTGIKQDSTPFTAFMQLSNAVLDGDKCIQVSVRAESSSNSSTGTNTSTGTDASTANSLRNNDNFLNQLHAAAQQAISGTSLHTLLFISIDNFSQFRSTWGIIHTFDMAASIANFIQKECPKNTILTQYCDDGFALLLPQMDSNKTLSFAKSLCNKVEDQIIETNGQSTQCTISIGLVTLDKQNKDDANVLIQNAFGACETLRKNKKNNGIGNGALMFVPSRGLKAIGSAAGEDDLDKTLEEALEDQRFTLAYQPVVSLRGTTGDHYEVQTMLTNNDEQEVPADEFLKGLAFTNPNTRLDRWTIIEATKKLAMQQKTRHDTRLFINLTANALLDESLIPWLSFALKAGDIKPQALIFQFHEFDITNYLKPAKIFTESIQALGCKLSITNFGNIDDPYKTLKQVDANYAKISSGFAQELESGGDTQMLKAMVNSINELNTQAIIGNIENASALAVLWQLGVDYIQGDYLAAPTKQMDYEFTDIA